MLILPLLGVTHGTSCNGHSVVACFHKGFSLLRCYIPVGTLQNGEGTRAATAQTPGAAKKGGAATSEANSDPVRRQPTKATTQAGKRQSSSMLDGFDVRPSKKQNSAREVRPLRCQQQLLWQVSCAVLR